MTATTYPASAQQRWFACKLESERQVPVGGQDRNEAFLIARLEDLHEIGDDRRNVSTREASQVIDWLLTLPLSKQGSNRPSNNDSEIGVYVLDDGSIVKVQPNKAKTSCYSMLWIEIRGERLVDHDESRVNGEWEYAPQLIRQCDDAHRMTLEAAKAFILRYGRCVRCSRKLKAADSVERGIGPVCVNYFSSF